MVCLQPERSLSSFKEHLAAYSQHRVTFIELKWRANMFARFAEMLEIENVKKANWKKRKHWMEKEALETFPGYYF